MSDEEDARRAAELLINFGGADDLFLRIVDLIEMHEHWTGEKPDEIWVSYEDANVFGGGGSGWAAVRIMDVPIKVSGEIPAGGCYTSEGLKALKAHR